jgi:hypothetical protein
MFWTAFKIALGVLLAYALFNLIVTATVFITAWSMAS